MTVRRVLATATTSSSNVACGKADGKGPPNGRDGSAGVTRDHDSPQEEVSVSPDVEVDCSQNCAASYPSEGEVTIAELEERL